MPSQTLIHGPALGLLEMGSVARGILVADAMVKHSPVELVQASPTTPGKFLAVVFGGEEEVQQALQIGREIASTEWFDQLYLPKPDPQLVPVILGKVFPADIDSLGIVETFSVASCILAADHAAKTADITLVSMQLARGLGGKAFFMMTGVLDQLEAGVTASRQIMHSGMLLSTEIIPRPHVDLLSRLWEPPLI